MLVTPHLNFFLQIIATGTALASLAGISVAVEALYRIIVRMNVEKESLPCTCHFYCYLVRSFGAYLLCGEGNHYSRH